MGPLRLPLTTTAELLSFVSSLVGCVRCRVQGTVTQPREDAVIAIIILTNAILVLAFVLAVGAIRAGVD